jgi:hypothetical protein
MSKLPDLCQTAVIVTGEKPKKVKTRAPSPRPQAFQIGPRRGPAHQNIFNKIMGQ